MNNFSLKRIIVALILVILLGASFAGGVYAGTKKTEEVKKVTALFNKESEEVIADIDFEPFWKVWNIIEEKYPNGKITNQDKVWGAISGLASSLNDPYTVFFPPKENKNFKDEISGSFGGVGMEVGKKEGVLVVIAPLKKSPAEKAGIKAGDVILKIDETPATDLSVEKAISLIRGKEGTKVKLTIKREGEKELKEIDVTREIISLEIIDTELREDGIFVISLSSFSEDSANHFRNALREFVGTKKGKLVLDLRGNPGGYLNAAVDMASWFLPAGKPIVKEHFANGDAEQVYRSKGYDIFTKNLKMVILVDKGSASASEILAGALKEYDIAKLVGTKTYGKGSVQELIDITPETSLKITIAKWFTPDGLSISDEGLAPDVLVEAGDDKDKDLQLDKAIEILNQ